MYHGVSMLGYTVNGEWVYPVFGNLHQLGLRSRYMVCTLITIAGKHIRYGIPENENPWHDKIHLPPHKQHLKLATPFHSFTSRVFI